MPSVLANLHLEILPSLLEKVNNHKFKQRPHKLAIASNSYKSGFS